MKVPGVRSFLAAAIVTAFPGVAAAQFPPPPPPPGSPPSTVQERWPEPPKPRQPDRAQTPAPQAAPKRQPAQAKSAQTPAPQAAPKRPPAQAKSAPAGAAAKMPAHKPKPRRPTHVIVCRGVFGKDSSQLKLALKYNSRNIVYGQVDGSDGSKLNASILFPSDPARRLEVLWNNEAARSDTSVIAINGKSQWIAPKGLKLGLTIAALEKLNGRPFKLTGFGKDGSASVVGWEGGALMLLPGGCKVGMRLFENPKVPEAARNTVAGKKEFLSNNASVRAVEPKVGEILIGY